MAYLLKHVIFYSFWYVYQRVTEIPIDITGLIPVISYPTILPIDRWFTYLKKTSEKHPPLRSCSIEHPIEASLDDRNDL